MARKTIKRSVVIERLNVALRADHLSDDEKILLCTFVESVLIKGNAYEGYTIPEPGAGVSQRTYM